MIAMFLYAATAIWAGLYAHDARNFGIALFCHTLISGIFLTASASLPQRLLPRSRFAELMSAGGLLGSVLLIILPFGLGTFLDYTGHNYSYTFYLGGAFAVAALLLLFALYQKFMALGGPTAYIAPENEEPSEPMPSN